MSANKKRLWFLVVLAILTAAAVWYINRPTARTYVPEDKLPGIQWIDTGSTEELMSEVWVAFDGTKDENGEFAGNITIGSGEEILYQWNDCEIVYDLDYFLCEGGYDDSFGSRGASFTDMFSNCYAIVITDENWTEFTFIIGEERPDGTTRISSGLPRVTVGATTIDEARERAQKVAEGSFFENFF